MRLTAVNRTDISQRLCIIVDKRVVLFSIDMTVRYT